MNELKRRDGPLGARRNEGGNQSVSEIPADSSSLRVGSTPNLMLLSSFYLCEACALLIVLALYRFSSKPSATEFLSSLPGIVFVVALVGLALSLGVIAYEYLCSRKAGSRQFGKYLMMNLIAVMITTVAGEVSLRLMATKNPGGGGEVLLGNRLLPPREWQLVVRHFSGILQTAASKQNYLVYDHLLGWTVGANRRSEDGLYFSSVEGIRSLRMGVAYRDRPSTCRIALVGDSFTFAQEVMFEDSWGYQLELGLPAGCHVLNFGVPSYGVDQMYLRYLRDVRPWHPNIVILGFIGDDLLRTMNVYRFLSSRGSGIPWAKPRFVLKDQRPLQVNVPLPEPKEIFSAKSIEDLPYINYELNYRPTEWDHRPYWRLAHSSYLFRFLISLYPLWDMPREEVSDEAMESINRVFFRSFIQQASSEGSIPILVYFPSAEDVLRYQRSRTPVSLKVLREAGVMYTDLTPCLSDALYSKEVAPSDAWTKQGAGHYTRHGNAVVARCLHGVVAGYLAATK